MINPVQNALAATSVQGVGGLQEAQGLNALTPALSPVREPGFDTVMAEMVAAMANDVRHGEQVSMDALKGEATTQEVVQAVMSAERSLQTALAIRDKIVTAYLEISRMAI